MTDPAATPATAPARGGKRAAILDATLRLIARSGLHSSPVDVVAREAGVSAGTLYRYFPSKDALINALYLEVIRDRDTAIAAATGAQETPSPDLSAALWPAWHALARWHLDHPEASSVLLQVETSGILTAETRATEGREQAGRLPLFEEAVARGFLRDLPRPVFWALFVGPIVLLLQLREAGQVEVTDEVLRATFEGVCTGVLPRARTASGADPR
jgi:TetR/AcrR family transcriptional regulator, repressor of fatR-cypB operon